MNRSALLAGAAALVVGAATAVLPTVAGAVPMSGDTVDVTASSPGGAGTISPTFTSPVIVAPGVTDTATFSDVFSQVWDLTLDFTATGFTVDFSAPGDENANVENGLGVVDIVLDDLTRPIGPVVRTGYSCVGSIACDLPPSDTVTVNGSTADLLYTTMVNQQTYTYAAAAVPEPASLWLLAAGLLGLASRHRRRHG